MGWLIQSAYLVTSASKVKCSPSLVPEISEISRHQIECFDYDYLYRSRLADILQTVLWVHRHRIESLKSISAEFMLPDRAKSVSGDLDDND